MIAFALRMFTSRLAGPIATLVAVLLLLGMVSQCTAKDSALRAVHSLTASIETPKTGWAARLADCHATTEWQSAEITHQSAKVEAQAATMEAQLAAADKLAADAQRSRAEAERNAAKLTALQKRFGPATCADPDLAAADAAVLGAIR